MSVWAVYGSVTIEDSCVGARLCLLGCWQTRAGPSPGLVVCYCRSVADPPAGPGPGLVVCWDAGRLSCWAQSWSGGLLL